MNVRIVEVGPRDGLQNEKEPIPTEAKVALVDALSDAGYEEIEVSAFVSPKWIPQLADASEVFARIQRRSGVLYSALVPNEQGLERALESRVGKIAVFTAASESFNKKNINATIEESIARFASVVPRALDADFRVRGYISTAFHCPYEGKIDPVAVVAVAKRLLDLGVEELSIGDTIGKATPEEVNTLLDRLLDAVPQDEIALHFHDTYGRAVENAVAGFERGVTIFDSSVGGVGGCPYAPGAAGNVATEDLVAALQRAGAIIELDLGKIGAASALLATALGRQLRPSARPSA